MGYLCWRGRTAIHDKDRNRIASCQLRAMAVRIAIVGGSKMMLRPGISSEAAVVYVLLLLRLLRDLLLIQMVEKTTLRNFNRLS